MIVIDDFLPDLAIVQRAIVGVEYGDHEFMGKTYTGFGAVTLPLKALIEEVCGPISIRVSHLRKGTKATPLTHYIHADAAAAKWGMVLCLSQPKTETGTAFWKHLETGLEALPIPTPPELFAKLDRDLTDLSKWTMTEMVPTVENRALIFEAARFHSRSPKNLDIPEGEKPRIVCTTFFDLNQDIRDAQELA